MNDERVYPIDYIKTASKFELLGAQMFGDKIEAFGYIYYQWRGNVYLVSEPVTPGDER